MESKIYISILNKIKHKPISLKYIFTFSEERPFIFPYILSKDKNFKKQLKNTFSSIRKDNNLSEMNIIIHKFVTYRLLSETKIIDYYDFPKNWDNRTEWGFDDINLLFEYDKTNNVECNDKQSLIDYYNEILIGNFYKKQKDKNIHIKESTIEKYIPKEQKLKNFIKDYFSLREILFIPYDDNNYINLINEIFDYLIEAKIYIKEIIFHEKYMPNYKNYLKYFMQKLREQQAKLVGFFNSEVKIIFDKCHKCYHLKF